MRYFPYDPGQPLEESNDSRRGRRESLTEAAGRWDRPVEIRRRNLARKGEAFIPNDTPADGDWLGALASAERVIDWHAPLGKHRGRGIALGLKSSSTASASLAIVRLHYDASVSVLSGTSDMGQGARTVLAQIAGKELVQSGRSDHLANVNRSIDRHVGRVHVFIGLP